MNHLVQAAEQLNGMYKKNIIESDSGIIDGNEVFLATLSSNENGGFCFAIDELAKYVIKY